MITPNSSPTKQMDSSTEIGKHLESKEINCEQKNGKLDNLSPKVNDRVFHLNYDSDLDLNSIEEDDLF